MLSWIKYLVYVLSFFIPPVGVITFWVFAGRQDELKEIAKWSFLAAFVGVIAWVIVGAVTGYHRMFFPGRY